MSKVPSLSLLILSASRQWKGVAHAGRRRLRGLEQDAGFGSRALLRPQGRNCNPRALETKDCTVGLMKSNSSPGRLPPPPTSPMTPSRTCTNLHTLDSRGHVRRDPGHAPSRCPTPGRSRSSRRPAVWRCACAARGAQGGANPARRKGRGGAALPWP